MYSDQKNEDSPFQEACDTGNFFEGGGRGAILNDIKTAFDEKVNFVTLIGEEGSGKTMLCKMLLEQWKTKHRVLFLPELVESFEDIVRVVAQECDLQYPEDTNRADAKKIFLKLVATLRVKGESLLLICDEAETMYLATLERMRKILDEVNAEGGGLQILLAGRKSLRGNLEQLTLCNFEMISEKQFFLSALDDNETWNYLNFCAKGLRAEDQQEVFTMEASAKISSMGRGNLRLINMYAEESLQSSGADTSFLVLLDHVKDDGKNEDLLSSKYGILEHLPLQPKYFFGGMAACLVVLIAVLFFGDGDKKKSAESVINQQNSPLFKGGDVGTENGSSASVPGKPEESGADLAVVEEVVRLQKIELVEKTGSFPVNVQEPPQYTPVDISPVEIVEKTEIDPTVAKTGIGTIITADKSKRLVSTRIERSQQKRRLETPSALSSAATPPAHLLNDPVLGKFFAAGQKWQNGEKAASFSIQLMALKSEQAKTNLKQIVSQSDYQAVADKLVMLQKPSEPPVLLVFYGVYPTMAAARNARKNMPIFLRDRHPYPVSVRGAVEKARVE